MTVLSPEALSSKFPQSVQKTRDPIAVMVAFGLVEYQFKISYKDRTTIDRIALNRKSIVTVDWRQERSRESSGHLICRRDVFTSCKRKMTCAYRIMSTKSMFDHRFACACEGGAHCGNFLPCAVLNPSSSIVCVLA